MHLRYIAVIGMLLLTGCTVPDSSPAESAPVPFVQEEVHLRLDCPTRDYAPLNYTHQIGLWFPYMHFGEYMTGRTEEEFRTEVRTRFTEAAEMSVNTVYLHVHPCGDAYYDSELFPRGAYFDGSYDPLAVMTDEAHALGLSVHAWLNPLRCQTSAQMSALPDSFIVKQWAEDPECSFVRLVGDRWYLNPAYPEVRELICSCAEELLDSYELDGIHIDDYFYPTTATDFDSEAFEASGASDLSQWRTENCTSMVKALYDTVKSHGRGVEFGISPQGNIRADYSTQYADVRLWGGVSGYCDYIVPQIYFGFLNETCPFEPTLREWEELVGDSGVRLVIGLAGYKQGAEDQWAGAAGEREWIDYPDVIERQIALAESSSAAGYALYY